MLWCRIGFDGSGREWLYGKISRHAESARSLKYKSLRKRENDDRKFFCSVLLMREHAVLRILCRAVRIDSGSHKS